MHINTAHKLSNILITGATSGIGEALAEAYAKRGAKQLFICGRDETRLAAVAEKCRTFGADVHADIIDVRDADAVAEWLTRSNAVAPLDAVFANAGVSTGIENAENVRNTFSVNINGVLNTVLPTIDLFKVRETTNTFRGHIAITASVAGYHGLPSCPAYSATKACVKAWGEGLRGMLRTDGIRVSVICPGFVRSRITEKNTCPMPFFMEADKAARIIMRRIDNNVGLIVFPWPMRLAVWFLSCLPNRLTDAIYARLPEKV